MQLYEQLRGDIVGGAYAYGTRLPSKRLLAEEAGTSVITVSHAYGILCDEGYAEARERHGYFAVYRASDFIGANVASPGKQAAAAAATAFAGTLSRFPDGDAHTAASSAHNAACSAHTASAIHRSVGGETFPFSVLARTMRRVILDAGEELLEASPNAGIARLRAAIAAYLRRSCGIEASAGQIVVGSGAEHLYTLIVQLLGVDLVYATEDPCYPKIRQVYETCGARCEPLALGEDGVVSETLRRSRANVLHITPFHSFPSGVTASASKRREYVRWALERGAYIIEDNYDSELTVSKKNEDALFSLCSDERAIYLNTFTHTLSRSMRVGYMVLSPDLAELFSRKLGFYSCTVPVFEQYLIAELIESGDFERHVNRVRRMRRRAAEKA